MKHLTKTRALMIGMLVMFAGVATAEPCECPDNWSRMDQVFDPGAFRFLTTVTFDVEDLEHGTIATALNWKFRIKPTLMAAYDGRTQDALGHINVYWHDYAVPAVARAPGWSAMVGATVGWSRR